MLGEVALVFPLSLRVRVRMLRRHSRFLQKCKSIDEVRKHGHVLTPGRYVGVEAALKMMVSRLRRKWLV